MDCSVQGDIRTPPDFGPLFSDSPLLLCILSVRGLGRCKPRQAILYLGSCGSTAVQGAAPVALVRGSLARRALTGLGPAPLAGPIRAKAPFITSLKPTFCHLKNHRIYEVLLCHICSRIARCRLLGSWPVIRVATPNASSARATISAGCEVGDSWCKYPNETTCE